MNVEFDIGGDQIDGARDYQEDAFMVSQLGETPDGQKSALIIMADGMGGHAAGNIASNMVVASFNKSFQSQFPPKKPPNALNKALLSANEQIATSVKETPALSGMGCTMVTAYLEGNDLWWVSVGDSHLYLIRNKELIKQNADHSYGAFLDLMIEQGEEVDETAGMSRNMLMSAMTGVEISSIDCPESPLKVEPGDRVIIASDGLDTIGAGAIIQYSAWSNTAKECVYALLKAVEDVKRKKQDNTTIIVVDIKGKPDAEKANPQLSTNEEPKQQSKARKRITDLVIEDEEQSSGIILKLFIILVLVGGGYYAWVSGLIDNGLASISGLVTKDIGHSNDISPPIVTLTEKSTLIKAPAVNKAPVYTAPRKPPSIKKPQTTVAAPVAKSFNDTMTIGGTAPAMMNIPQGKFRMGGASAFVAPDESPRHVVTLKAFAISQYEVTFAEYAIFAKATGKKAPDSKTWDKDNHPVIQVSWNDALQYTQWLSLQTGFKYRLPSESEWEYAARAGTSTSYWWGSDKGINNAQCFDCGGDLNPNKPAKIGSFKANNFGLYDILGNVFEWTHDCYHNNYINAPTDGSSWDGGDCSVRVARGGAYASPASSMRASNREKFKSNQGRDHIGIRLAREL